MNITEVSKEERSSFIADAFKQACMAELTALKPGNVHIFADGHGMVVQDFIKSAEVVADVIAQPGLTVGQRILSSVQATWQAVGCNTNLGIILLAAPLIQAALLDNESDLQENVHLVLSELTVEDAILAYQAIKLASPAGLGRSEQHDVSLAPSVTLLVGMQQAQERDMIARQYANDYKEIMNFGLSCYDQAMAKWQQPAWAVSALYLGFLARYNDSHISRKYGDVSVKEVRKAGRKHHQALSRLENPKLYQRELMKWDSELKQRKLNPGTSADLTVATIFVASII
ncbi:MAG TPA: triphosphoribosyl-dephospho-CoA synthase [Methylophilaceae bacterium]|nr:triphosphoribosyl-dephospho-CoA synthase [Methylophilaceae bacterium]